MEIEFKFHIPTERLKGVEAALRRAPVHRTRLQARYFDTASGALAAHGAVLRLRKEGRRWVQTAKALGDGPLHRLEHNVDLGIARAAAPPPLPDVERHAGTPVGERIAELLDDVGEPLIETYGTDIWRLSREVRVKGATIELALDTGRVVAHPVAAGGVPRVSPVCELELELVRGDVAGLVALAQRWSGPHGLWFSTVSKAERGERLMAGLDRVPAVKAKAPDFSRIKLGKKKGEKGEKGELDGPTVQRAVVAACLAQILPNASELAAGSDAEETIHQLRIGIRRLRTALREFAALGPGFDPAWEAPLVAVFRGLGAQRDRELLVQAMAPRLHAAGAPPIDLPGDGAQAAASAGTLVRAPGFQAALVGLIGFAAQDASPDTAAADVRPAANGASAANATDSAAESEVDASPAGARRHLRTRLGKLHAHTLQDAKRFDSLDAEARHKVRKRLKRLRYLAEFVAPLFDADAADRYLDRLGPAQDALGVSNDEAAALAAYRAAAEVDPRAWFAVGWLTARQLEGVRASQKALRKIGKAPKFWTRKKG